jgi:hypothetical protein
MKIEKMQQNNYTSTNNENNEQLFVMFHMANSITRNASNINNVWYVDSKTSNQMWKIIQGIFHVPTVTKNLILIGQIVATLALAQGQSKGVTRCGPNSRPGSHIACSRECNRETEKL